MKGEARAIYLGACARIADEFAAEGFHYRASKQLLIREAGDISHEIWFQSSFRNHVFEGAAETGIVERLMSWLPLGDALAFGHVKLIAHATVRSKTIRTWRSSFDQPLSTTDVIAGGQIGNLQTKHKWIEFNLANPHRRDQVIQDVNHLIRSVALPYFARFDRPEEVIWAIQRDEIYFGLEATALEYTCCFGSVEKAASLLRHYLDKHPAWREEYENKIGEYQREGIPEAFESTAGGRLAKAALALGLHNSDAKQK